MAIVKLGNTKNAENQIKIDDPTVSFNHLQIEYINENELFITDLRSKNGTKVIRENGKEVEILEGKVRKNDILIIGQNRRKVETLIDEVKAIIYRDKVIWYEEFAALEKEFKSYQNSNRKLIGSYTIKVQIIKYSLIGLLFIVFILFGKQLGIPEAARYGISIIGSILAVFITEKIFSKGNYEEKRKSIAEDYSKTLKCPKCSKSLVGKSFKYWSELRICPSCQANWVR